MNKRTGYIAGVLLAVLAAALILGYFLLRPPETPGTSLADGGDASLPYAAGPFRFKVTLSPATPVVGDNQLTLMLRTTEGEPVTGAEINAAAVMAAMGAMPEMRAPAEMTELTPGVYQGTFQPTMDGAWLLTLSISKQGLGQVEVRFNLATGREGIELASGARLTSMAAPGATPTGPSISALPPGTIQVDARRRQLIGVTTGQAKVRELTHDIRSYGYVTYDQTQYTDVSLKFKAWIGELKADFEGTEVEEGEVLFTVYSPELYSAQQEYLAVYQSGNERLIQSARQRLKFWDLSTAQVQALEQRGAPVKYIPISAPRSGTVVMKQVVEGSAIPAGATLMRIADLSRVWVEAEVYEQNLALIEPGMPADISLTYLPARDFQARVEDVYPYLDTDSRTGRVRLSLDNPKGLLKPGMYAEVTLRVPQGEALAVPSQAVIIAGETRVVFEDLGDGYLAPRFVTTGRRTAGYVEILSGLEPGAVVVTSGNFLIASESRLKSALGQWQ